jgi:uncharacterized membrane protein
VIGIREIAWFMLLFWSALAQALTGTLKTGMLSARWAPDLGLLLFLAVAARLGRKDLAAERRPVGFVGILLISVAARLAFSVQAVAPVLAGFLAVLFWQNTLRRGLDVERPLVRIVVASGAGVMLFFWWRIVRETNLGDVIGGSGSVSWADVGAWRGVLLTSALAPILMPLCLRLPGLSPLWGRK